MVQIQNPFGDSENRLHEGSIEEHEDEGSNHKLQKKWQFLASGVAATGSFGLGTVTAWSSPTYNQIRNEFEATDNQLTWVASLFPVGAIFSGVASGLFVEKIGRQRSMQLFCIPFILGWILIASANTIGMLYAGRFLIGFCAGAQPLLLSIYVSEIVDEKIRGICTGFFAIFAATGIFVTYVLGAAVSWLTLSILCGTVPFIGIVALHFIPETPIYLLKKGAEVQATISLNWFQGGRLSGDELNSRLEKMKQELNEGQSISNVTCDDILKPSMLKPLGTVLVLMFVQQFSGVNAIVFYANPIFQMANALDPGLSSIVIAGVNLASCLVCMQFMDRVGRKKMWIISATGVALALICLGTYFFVNSDPEINLSAEDLLASVRSTETQRLKWLPLASLVLFNVFFTAGLGPVPFIYMAEVLPSRIIGMASGFSICVNWILCFCVTKSFDSLKDGLGDAGIFWMFAGICIAGAIFVMFIPETKGKSLYEIQRSYS